MYHTKLLLGIVIGIFLLAGAVEAQTFEVTTWNTSLATQDMTMYGWNIEYFNDTAYSCVGSFDTTHGCSNATDEDYTTYAHKDAGAGEVIVYENRTVVGSVKEVTWMWKVQAPAVGISASVECWNYSSNDWFMVRNETNFAVITFTDIINDSCINSNFRTKVTLTRGAGAGAVYYDGTAFFNITSVAYVSIPLFVNIINASMDITGKNVSNIYPHNVSIDLFDDGTVDFFEFDKNSAASSEQEAENTAYGCPNGGITNCTNAYDEDWTTFAFANAIGADQHVEEGFTIPNNLTGANWTFRYNEESQASVHLSCWDGTNNVTFFGGVGAATSVLQNRTIPIPIPCLDFQNELRIQTFLTMTTMKYYEGNVTWIFADTAKTTITFDPLAIQSYIDSCSTISGSFCNVPISINSVFNRSYVEFDMSGSIHYTYQFLIECGGLSNSTALNLSFFDEENRTGNVRSNIELSFNTTLGINETVLSFNATNVTNLELCIFPDNASYVIDGTIKYTNSSGTPKGYSTRYYFLQNYLVDNITDNINLFLLEDALSNQITFIIKSIFNIPEPDIIVKVTRFFIADGSYIHVASALSDFSGKATTQLKLNEWYILILESQGVILRTVPQIFLVSTADVEIFTTEGTSIDYFTYYDSLGAACTQNDLSRLLTCTFSDTSGKMVDLVLTIEQNRLVGGFVDVCTNSTTSSAGTISCSYLGYNDTELQYALNGKFSGPHTTFFTLLTGSIITFIPSPYGITGVIVLFFIMLAGIMYGYWNPVVPIITGIFGIFIGITLQLIVVSGTAFASLVVAGAFIIYKLRT